MTSTRTISGRVARVVVVLAALASLTGASVAQASTQPGAKSQWLKASGLRWQAIARAHQLRQPAIPRYYGSRSPYAPTMGGTQPLPAYVETRTPAAAMALHFAHEDRIYTGSREIRSAPYTPQGLKADGLRWQGIARVYEQNQQGTQAASVTTSNGFNWGDAGIGVAVGIGAMLLAGGAAMSLLKQGRLATH